ncbi:MAG: transketolase family protein [Dehalococcoidia bacterium]
MKIAPPEMSPREAYGRALVELGKEREDLVVVDADLSPSTMTRMFAQEFPERFIDCGVAEQNLMSIAAGLAASGKTVFASTFATFATRAFDQIRIGISQPRLNVKIVATHGGITVGEDGFSHHAIEDLALMCSLPTFTVIVPADAVEADQAVKAAAALPGPFYIRLSRPKIPVVYTNGCEFVPGKAVAMRPGSDVTIIATGVMVAKALEAAESLKEQGIDCRVVNMPTLKPLDEEAILRAAQETGAVVTAEEHRAQGGLGSRVSQVVVGAHPVPMALVAIGDVYTESGKPEELLKKYGLAVEDIERAVHSVLARK